MAFQSSPRTLVFTPTKLSTYKRCPLEYHAKYVERVASPVTFEPVLARANAAHAVLAEAFNRFRIDRSFPIGLQGRIESRLPESEYPDRGQWLYEVELITEWVLKALSRFDGYQEVRGVEQTLEYRFPGISDYPPFVLRARVDLILEHPSGEIEHIDWKTGSSVWVDAIQNVSSRIVTGQAYSNRPVRSSTVFLPSGVERSQILDRDTVKDVWNEIKHLVLAIQNQTSVWEAEANPLCSSCPMYTRGCPLHATEAEANQMTFWLEDVA